MSTRFTIAQLEELKAKGKIKGFTATKPAPKAQKQGKVASKEKEWLSVTLKAWCEERGYLLIREHTFSEERDWRFDWAVFNGRKKVVAVEYEGIMSKKSRHTTISGFTEDSDKYRAAALDGWKVLRYTAKNFKNILNDLNKLL